MPLSAPLTQSRDRLISDLSPALEKNLFSCFPFVASAPLHYYDNYALCYDSGEDYRQGSYNLLYTPFQSRRLEV